MTASSLPATRRADRTARSAAGASPIRRQPDGRAGRPMLLALLWSVTTVIVATAWLAGLLPHPFGDANAAATGAVFNTSPPHVGSTVTLLLGLVGVGTALRARHRPRSRSVEAAAWVIGAFIALVLIHGKLLMVLGYTLIVPVLGWAMPDLFPAYVAAVQDPEVIFLLHCALGAAVWGWAATLHRRSVRGASDDGGHGHPQHDGERTRAHALRVGRGAVAVAVASALVYPSLRIPWMLGIPVGLDEEAWAALQAQPGTVEVGVALGAAAIGGAILMVGLVARWGERFPRWMVGLAGREVPLGLAVVPASVVAIALVAMGRGTIVLTLTGLEGVLVDASAVHVLAFVAMLPWGVALGVATAAYVVRRRAGERGVCEPGPTV